MTSNQTKQTPLMERLIELLGPDAAQRLADEFGGQVIYFRFRRRAAASAEPIRNASAPTAAGQDSTGFDLGAVLADRALPVAAAIASQDDLLASLEARLANEMRDFTDAVLKFASATQAISKELPASAQFGKLITLFLGTFSLQTAYAFLKDGDVPLLLDDGAQYLHKLGLRVNELFRELDMDGRRFLAIALPEQGHAQILKNRNAARSSGNQ